MSQASQSPPRRPTTMQKLLGAVERVGNRVPHPVVIFLILIAIVIVLSQILYMLGAERFVPDSINPVTHEVDPRDHRGARPADGRGHPVRCTPGSSRTS